MSLARIPAPVARKATKTTTSKPAQRISSPKVNILNSKPAPKPSEPQIDNRNNTPAQRKSEPQNDTRGRQLVQKSTGPQINNQTSKPAQKSTGPQIIIRKPKLIPQPTGLRNGIQKQPSKPAKVPRRQQPQKQQQQQQKQQPKQRCRRRLYYTKTLIPVWKIRAANTRRRQLDAIADAQKFKSAIANYVAIRRATLSRREERFWEEELEKGMWAEFGQWDRTAMWEEEEEELKMEKAEWEVSGEVMRRTWASLWGWDDGREEEQGGDLEAGMQGLSLESVVEEEAETDWSFLSPSERVTFNYTIRGLRTVREPSEESEEE